MDSRYAKRRPGEWFVTLIRKADDRKPALMPESEGVVHELTARGVKLASARKIAAEFSQDRIREKILLHDWLLASGDGRKPRKPSGFLAAAIRDDYELPRELAASQRVATPRNSAEKRQSPENDHSSNERLEAARKYLSSLGTKERLKLEAAAVAKGNRFHAATYRRLKEQGSPLWEQLRDSLVANYLESQGVDLARCQDGCLCTTPRPRALSVSGDQGKRIWTPVRSHRRGWRLVAPPVSWPETRPKQSLNSESICALMAPWQRRIAATVSVDSKRDIPSDRSEQP